MGIFRKLTQEYSSNFDELINQCGFDNLENFCTAVYTGYCKQFTAADYLKNVEWILRHYQASKKIILSALFFKQTDFLLDRRMKNLSYYTMYYSLFNALSANVMLLPYLPLNKITRISHSQIFKEIDNYFIRSNIYDQSDIELLNNLRLMREAYSYYLPLGSSSSRKDESFGIDELFQSLSSKLPVIYQVSSLLSYLSYYAWNKKVGAIPDDYEDYQSECDEMFFSFIEIRDHLRKHCLIDDDDYYRQAYLLRKFSSPFPIGWFITEKMCEDLECGWEQKEDDDYDFDINDVASYISKCIE